MASPHVAATAALIIASGVLGRHPSPAQVDRAAAGDGATLWAGLRTRGYMERGWSTRRRPPRPGGRGPSNREEPYTYSPDEYVILLP